MKSIPNNSREKSEIYLGTSLEQLDQFYEMGDFGDSVFTDSLDVAKDDSYSKDIKGLTGMVLMAKVADLPTLTMVDSDDKCSLFVLDKPVHPSCFVAV